MLENNGPKGTFVTTKTIWQGNEGSGRSSWKEVAWSWDVAAGTPVALEVSVRSSVTLKPNCSEAACLTGLEIVVTWVLAPHPGFWDGPAKVDQLEHIVRGDLWVPVKSDMVQTHKAEGRRGQKHQGLGDAEL